jgi:MraZ protein
VIDLSGEYNVTVDLKNRFLMPNALRKQYPDEQRDVFMVNRGFEKCLRLYSIQEWEKISAHFSKLNQLNPKVRDFIRMFRSGATKIELDTAGRLLLPKELLEHAGIAKDATVSALGNVVEIWDTKTLKKYFVEKSDSFSDLAEEIAGGNFMNPFDKKDDA